MIAGAELPCALVRLVVLARNRKADIGASSPQKHASRKRGVFFGAMMLPGELAGLQSHALRVWKTHGIEATDNDILFFPAVVSAGRWLLVKTAPAGLKHPCYPKTIVPQGDHQLTNDQFALNKQQFATPKERFGV